MRFLSTQSALLHLAIANQHVRVISLNPREQRSRFEKNDRYGGYLVWEWGTAISVKVRVRWQEVTALIWSQRGSERIPAYTVSNASRRLAITAFLPFFWKIRQFVVRGRCKAKNIVIYANWL